MNKRSLAMDKQYIITMYYSNPDDEPAIFVCDKYEMFDFIDDAHEKILRGNDPGDNKFTIHELGKCLLDWS